MNANNFTKTTGKLDQIQSQTENQNQTQTQTQNKSNNSSNAYQGLSGDTGTRPGGADVNGVIGDKMEVDGVKKEGEARGRLF